MSNIDNISGWRERVFSSLLSIALVVGLVSTIAIVPVVLQLGLWQVALADTATLVWMFLIWRARHLSYTTRVLNFLAAVYVLAVVLMLSIGSATLSYLLGPPLIAVILLNLRSAIAATLLGVVALLLAGATGHIEFNVPGMEQAPFQASMLAVVNYSTVAMMLSLTCGKLLRGLTQSLDELELTSAAVARMNDMVIIAEAANDSGQSGRVIFVNDAFLSRTGYAREEVVGHSLNGLYPDRRNQGGVDRMCAAMNDHGAYKEEVMTQTKSGDMFWIEIEVMPFVRGVKEVSHWVIASRDITERRTAQQAIHRLAFYDMLTGLPNRRMLLERLGIVIAPAAEVRSLSAVLYLDIDNFKDVNDARGHAVGDALLERAAVHLNQAVRGKDTVARIGGDEFVILLEDLASDPATATRQSLKIAEKVRAALATPFELDGQPFSIAASIGVALATPGRSTAQDMLREADTAMYHAKASGRAGVMLFEGAMLEQAQHKLAMERDLAAALENGELAMHLQLQVDCRAQPVGAEMLMRWCRADGTMVRPDIFIPVAESSGLIVPLGLWALRTACDVWLSLDHAGHPLRLSVNVSPLQFRQHDFVRDVCALMAEKGMPPDQLILEVTEGLFVDDIEQTIARMRQLADTGIRFSVDDFGTGYSNLAYLKKMPLYELKIDKSFVRDVPDDHNSTAIIQSILAMAGHLGLRVVAEGVETADQAQYFSDHHQASMQGYFFHRPMPLKDTLQRLREYSGPVGATVKL